MLMKTQIKIKIYSVLAIVSLSNTFKVKVKVENGIILGLKETTVFENVPFNAFYRVPYAQAPIGKLRFKDPKPLKKWVRILDATKEYNGACAQDHIVHKHGVYGFENCLYLNIYSPHVPKDKSDKIDLKAVIVWVHGYAFTSSFSHIYGPDFFIDNGVVVITLTHRIGPFGFLKLNETDDNANMGLKDIVMALKWIRRNIDQFGGDKRKITVMACGSASSYVSLLLVTKYKKLFSKLILHSGSIYSPSLFQGNKLVEKQRLEKELKKAGFKDIRTAPTEDILRASRNIYSKAEIINIQRPLIPFLPIQEKETNNSLLSMNINEIHNTININAEIPILIGFTSQESITELMPFIHNPHYLKLLHTFFKFMVPFPNKCNYNNSTVNYKLVSNKIKEQYFKTDVTEIKLQNLLKFVSDQNKYPIYKFMKSRITLGNKVFAYRFNYIGKFNAAKATSVGGAKVKIKGAAQGDELCYIFKCNPLWESYVKVKHNETDKDTIFIKEISQMWANFAKFGDPTPFHNLGSTTWLPMSAADDYIFHFDKQNKLRNTKPEQKMFEFWNQLYEKYYSDNNCNSINDEL